MRSIDIWRVGNGMFVEQWDELNTLQLLELNGCSATAGGRRRVIGLARIAVLGTAVVYGTDVFCAMVLRPALFVSMTGGWLR